MGHSLARIVRPTAALLMGGVLLAALAGAPVSPRAEEQKSGFDYERSPDLRDPFFALVRNGRVISGPWTQGGTGSGPVPVLYGILWDSGGNSIALIDDKEVRAGEEVRGYKIKVIRKDSVVVEKSDKETTLELPFKQDPGLE